MTFRVRGLLGILPLLLVAASYRAQARSAPKPPPKPKTKYAVVIFGDSISDTGNNFKAAGVPDPLVYTGSGVTGRFTNGLNWVDYMNATFTKKHSLEVHNYAHGGGTACAAPIIEALAPFVKNFTSQISTFIADVKSGKITRDANTKLLVIDFIGTVDYLIPFEPILRKGELPEAFFLVQLAKTVTACRMAGIQALASLTGIVTDIAVLPISPLRMSPLVSTAHLSGLDFIEELIGEYTLRAVAKLQAQFNASAPGTPGYGVKLYPINRDATWMYNGVSKVKPPFKYTNGTSCFANPSSLMIIPGIKPCSNPNDYLFFDTQHPTTRFHEWFGVRGLLPRLQTLRLLPY